MSERTHESVGVAGQGPAVVAARWFVGVAVAAEVDGDGALLVWNATLSATPEVVEAVEGLYDGGIARRRRSSRLRVTSASSQQSPR